MPDIRIFGNFKSHNTRQLIIDVHDANYSGGATEVSVNAALITWSAMDDDLLEPLKSSDLQFTFVKNSATDSLISAMLSGKEGDFTVKIRNASDNSLFWCGVIVIDECLVEDYANSANALFTIRAVDGIGRLKDFEFDKVTDSGFANWNTFLDYITTILNYNGLSGFWGASDTYIRESCELYDTQMTTTTAAYSPLKLVRSDKRYFSKEVSPESSGDSGSYTFTEGKNCFDILESILQIMCCRMLHVNGCYYIQQVRNFDGATYTERQISKSGTVLSNSNATHRVTHTTDDAYRLNGAAWSYKPPLQYISVFNTPFNFGMGYSTKTQGAVVQQSTPTATLTLNDVYMKRLDTTNKMQIVIPSRALVVGNRVGLSYRLKFEIIIVAGSYRVKNDGNGGMEWTTTSSDTFVFTIRENTIKKNNYQDANVPFVFESDELPFTEEEVDITINITLQNYFGIGSLSTKAAWLFTNPYVTTDADLTRDVEEWRVENPNTKNSLVKKYDKLVFSDNPNVVLAWNTFQVYDGSAWVNSNVWNAGFTTNEPLVRTLAMEHMSLQRYPVKVLDATIKHIDSDYILPNNTYYYENDTYVFNGGVLNLNNNQMQGQWFKLNLLRTDVAIEKWGDVSGKGWKNANNATNGNTGDGEPQEERGQEDALAIISANDSGTVTSISIDGVLRDNMKAGDNVHVYDGTTGKYKGFYEVSADVGSGDATISVTSKDLGVPLYKGDMIYFDTFELVATGLTRTKLIQTSSTSTPTTSTPDVLDKDGKFFVNPSDGYLYYRSGSTVYKMQGTPTL